MKNHVEIQNFCDNIGSVKQPSKHRHQGFWMVFGAFSLSFIIGMVLFFPVFNNRSALDILSNRIDSNSLKVQVLGDDIPEPYLYEYFTPPSNSFGIGNTTFKHVNWSYFKQLFNSHCDWSLEYDIGQGWVDGNEYMTIEKTWNESLGGWKFNLIFENPSSQNVKARFTFACDLPVLNYVERDGWQVNLNYTVPGTDEVYNCFFNWSDLNSYPGLWFNKGRTNDLFWFRFGHNSIPPGTYEFDPTFGYDGAYGYYASLYSDDVYSGKSYSPGVDGTVTSMTVYCYSSYWANGEKIKLALYDSSDKTFVDCTSERSDGGTGWQEFSADISIESGKSYYLAAYGDSSWRIGVAGLGDTITKLDDDSPGNNYPTFPSPSDYISSRRDTMIYATYTEGGGDEFTNVCPVASGEQPSNGSTNIELQPAVGVTLTDGNSNHTFNVTFAESSDDVTYYNRQTNSSVGNNTAVNWTYTQANTASTEYWWRVYVHDGFCNHSFTFSFTTKANETPIVWQDVESSWNGTFTNTTVWKDAETSWNGSFINNTNWQERDVGWNGTFTNTTVWKDADTAFNGSFTNITLWADLDTAFNGVFNNNSVWYDEDTDWNGSFINTTVWKDVETSWNGSFTNITLWTDLDIVFNGEFTNDTIIWQDVESSWNGTFTNDTVSWNIVEDSFNGRFINYTGTATGAYVMSQSDEMSMAAVFLLIGLLIGAVAIPIGIGFKKKGDNFER